jgi:hypothetical protein
MSARDAFPQFSANKNNRGKASLAPFNGRSILRQNESGAGLKAWLSIFGLKMESTCPKILFCAFGQLQLDF